MMVDFFFDTADDDYIYKLWKKIGKYVDNDKVRGITTNPNAFSKVEMKSLTQWEKQLSVLCELVSYIRGDKFGVVYVQGPSSKMDAEELLQFTKHITQFTDGNSSIGLKIPPQFKILEVVDELKQYTEINVTGVSDCSTALSCFTYDVDYVSLIPGRMEEVGINSYDHICFTQKNATNGEIISGSMRTIEGLSEMCQLGTVPTIGTRVWDQMEDSFDILLESSFDFNPDRVTFSDFSPTIDYKSRKLSEEFFVQMDECGPEVYSNVKQILSYSGN